MTITLLFIPIAILCVVAGFVVIRRRRSLMLVDPEADFDLDEQVGVTALPGKGTGLGDRVRALFGRGVSPSTWSELEDLLIRADVGPRGSADLVARVRERFEAGSDPVALLPQ